MPELPDVEVFRRYIEATSLHETILDVDVRDERILEDVSIDDMNILSGKRFRNTERRGKHCFVGDGKEYVVMHFGMTGNVSYEMSDGPEHAKVEFQFRNGYSLYYNCTRLLGKVTLTDDIQEYAEENDIGPDVLMLEEEDFISRLSSRRGQIKSALTDQSLMSGLGNIYSDEVLFQAGIHPRAPVKDIGEDEMKGLYGSMKEVMDASIGAGADPDRMPEGFLLPLREEGNQCPGDGGRISKTEVNGRSTFFCDRHQS